MFNPIFSKIIDDDINSCYFYIKDILQAPMAAENLMKELYVKIDKVLENPFFRPLVQDKNSAKTRHFYKKMGFNELITLTKMWDKYNPCLIMIKFI